MPRGVRRQPLAHCGVLAPAVFFGASVAAATAQSSYSNRRDDLSALAALDARHGGGALAWVAAAALRLLRGRRPDPVGRSSLSDASP